MTLAAFAGMQSVPDLTPGITPKSEPVPRTSARSGVNYASSTFGQMGFILNPNDRHIRRRRDFDVSGLDALHIG